MNPEYRHMIIGYISIALISIGTAFFIGRNAVCLTALAITAVTALFLYELRRRNKRVDELCDKIDKLLYEDAQWDFQSYEEGELSILQDKVQKLTIRLREQADMLKNEKQFQEQMMTDISHQLKTPLTSMNLILSRMRKETLSEEEQDKRLFELEQLVKRVDDLVVLLLKMAKLDSGTALMKQEQVNIGEMIRYAKKPLDISMDLRSVRCRLEGNEDACYMGDFDWSAEALGNILKNSIEHMPENGTINISFQENAIFSEICVEDDGCGMSKDELPHLFERFYRGKDARHSGVGIGMSLARMVIVRQNGTIKAENRSRGGMRFTIRFYKEII